PMRLASRETNKKRAMVAQGDVAAAIVHDTLYVIRLGSAPTMLHTQTFPDPVGARDIAIAV
ncbi:MAG: hypothetical protein KY455_14205, partial [Euryarchaeota archaeon]|nr:hypothetical protein [Euryarchaeota archaeon]